MPISFYTTKLLQDYTFTPIIFDTPWHHNFLSFVQIKFLHLRTPPTSFYTNKFLRRLVSTPITFYTSH